MLYPTTASYGNDPDGLVRGYGPSNNNGAVNLLSPISTAAVAHDNSGTGVGNATVPLPGPPAATTNTAASSFLATTSSTNELYTQPCFDSSYTNYTSHLGQDFSHASALAVGSADVGAGAASIPGTTNVSACDISGELLYPGQALDNVTGTTTAATTTVATPQGLYVYAASPSQLSSSSTTAASLAVTAPAEISHSSPASSCSDYSSTLTELNGTYLHPQLGLRRYSSGSVFPSGRQELLYHHVPSHATTGFPTSTRQTLSHSPQNWVPSSCTNTSNVALGTDAMDSYLYPAAPLPHTYQIPSPNQQVPEPARSFITPPFPANTQASTRNWTHDNIAGGQPVRRITPRSHSRQRTPVAAQGPYPQPADLTKGRVASRRTRQAVPSRLQATKPEKAAQSTADPAGGLSNTFAMFQKAAMQPTVNSLPQTGVSAMSEVSQLPTGLDMLDPFQLPQQHIPEIGQINSECQNDLEASLTQMQHLELAQLPAQVQLALRGQGLGGTHGQFQNQQPPTASPANSVSDLQQGRQAHTLPPSSQQPQQGQAYQQFSSVPSTSDMETSMASQNATVADTVDHLAPQTTKPSAAGPAPTDRPCPPFPCLPVGYFGSKDIPEHTEPSAFPAPRHVTAHQLAAWRRLPEQSIKGGKPSPNRVYEALKQELSKPKDGTDGIQIHDPDSCLDEGGYPYACTVYGCSLRFRHRRQMAAHRRSDHRQSTASPNSKSLKLSGKQICLRHNLRTGKPCDTLYTRPYDFTRHERQNHNPRAAKKTCHLCHNGKTFSRKDALERHWRTVHNISPEVVTLTSKARQRNASRTSRTESGSSLQGEEPIDSDSGDDDDYDEEPDNDNGGEGSSGI